MSLGDVVSNAPIRGFSQRADIPLDPVTGRPTGMAQVSDIQISRDSDAASPKLAFVAAIGTTTDTAQIVLAGGALTIGLQAVKVSLASTDSSQDGVPIEKLTVHFRKATYTYNSGSSSATFTYDPLSDRGSSGPIPFTPNFVFFGPGVDPGSYAGQTPFTKLVFGVTGPSTGRAVVSPLSLVTGVTAETIKQLSMVVAEEPTQNVTARFTAIDTSGVAVDRMRYALASTLASSVVIETSPTGVLQETMALQVGGKITWSAKPLAGGDEVSTEWDPTSNR
jgi:type VI protein secretion system component Hcp